MIGWNDSGSISSLSADRKICFHQQIFSEFHIHQLFGWCDPLNPFCRFKPQIKNADYNISIDNRTLCFNEYNKHKQHQECGKTGEEGHAYESFGTYEKLRNEESLHAYLYLIHAFISSYCTFLREYYVDILMDAPSNSSSDPQKSKLFSQFMIAKQKLRPLAPMRRTSWPLPNLVAASDTFVFFSCLILKFIKHLPLNNH